MNKNISLSILSLFTLSIAACWNPKSSQQTQAEQTTLETNINSSLPTKFKPEDFIPIMKRFDVNTVAGEAANKGFLKFDENWTVDDKNEDVSAYYYGEQISEDDRYNIQNSDYRKSRMSESIVSSNTCSCVFYTIKNQSDYLLFANHLNQIFTDTLSGRGKLYTECTHYLVNDCVFIDIGYNINSGGYRFQVFNASDFKKRIQSDKMDDSDLSDIDSSHVYVAVNSALVYEKPDADENANFNILHKGTKLKVAKVLDKWLCCDYVKNDSIPLRGWIHIDDVEYKSQN